MMLYVYDADMNRHEVSMWEIQHDEFTINNDGTVSLPELHLCPECV